MKYCAICEKKLPLGSIKTYIAGGALLCEECTNKTELLDPGGHYIADVEVCKGMIQCVEEYHEFVSRPTIKKYCESDALIIDATNQEFGVGVGGPFWKQGKLSGIIDIKYYDDTRTVEILTQESSSGAGKAIIGGLLFGGLGAIAGGLMGRKDARYRNDTYIEESGFVVTYNNGRSIKFNLLLLIGGAIKGVSTDDDLIQKAQSMTLAMTKILLPYIETEKTCEKTQNQNEMAQDNTGAQDILKVAELLEKGLLTQDEFDILKKRILSNETNK